MNKTYEEVETCRILDDKKGIAVGRLEGRRGHSQKTPTFRFFGWYGNIEKELWMFRGEIHRSTYPAMISYYINLYPGHNKTFEELIEDRLVFAAHWYLNGKHKKTTIPNLE